MCWERSFGKLFSAIFRAGRVGTKACQIMRHIRTEKLKTYIQDNVLIIRPLSCKYLAIRVFTNRKLQHSFSVLGLLFAIIMDIFIKVVFLYDVRQ